MKKIEGLFFAGTQSKKEVATLSVSQSQQIEVYSIDQETPGRTRPLVKAFFKDVAISPRLGNTPRYLTFPDGSTFETKDNDSIDDLAREFDQGNLYRLIHQLESKFLLACVFALVVIAFVWGNITYGVPIFAKATAAMLPDKTSQYLGQGTLQILDGTYFDTSRLSKQRQEELRTLFKGYAEHFPEQEFTFEFRQGGNIGPNAFALPDGTILFTDELVNLAKNDDQLVAILCHEIGHVVNRHLLRRIIQDSTLAVLWVLITGDIDSASTAVIAIPAILLELSYSREFEEEADDFALQFMLEHQLQPQHFAHIMQRLEEWRPVIAEEEVASQAAPQQGDNQTETDTPDSDSEQDSAFWEIASPYLSTHPITQERIDKFLTAAESSD